MNQSNNSDNSISKEKASLDENGDEIKTLTTEKIAFIHDSLFAVPQRFSIMLILSVHQKIGFTVLRNLLQLTPGNLNHHSNALINAGFIEKYKKLTLSRPMTMFRIKDFGLMKFRDYTTQLKSIIPDFNL